MMLKASPTQTPRYLFGPSVDFLCFGGSSLILVPLLFLQPTDSNREMLATIMLLLANVINHPHFAHSYQIFYRDFYYRCFSADFSRALRAQNVIAGIVIPLILIVFLLASFFMDSARMLGFVASTMVFVVGWHYVKQGYGLLMIDASLKKIPFHPSDKRALLINCYAVWFLSWLLVNLRSKEQTLWGISYFSLEIPPAVRLAFVLGTIVTSALALWTLVLRWRASGELPCNGIVAYAVSLYGWLLFADLNPFWLLIVPALHSIQYLAVAWRFQTNLEKVRSAIHEKETVKFVILGIGFGFVGFWVIPVLLDYFAPYNKREFGNTAALFAFWAFINIHHYFLDSVLWRRDNPDLRFLVSR